MYPSQTPSLEDDFIGTPSTESATAPFEAPAVQVGPAAAPLSPEPTYEAPPMQNLPTPGPVAMSDELVHPPVEQAPTIPERHAAPQRTVEPSPAQAGAECDHLNLQPVFQAMQVLVQGAVDATETRRVLSGRLEAAEEHARSLAAALDSARAQNSSLSSERNELNKQAMELAEVNRQQAAQITSFAERQEQQEARNAHLQKELQTAMAALVPAAIAPYYSDLLQRIPAENHEELRFQLHTLRYLSQRPEPSASRVTDAVVGLSKVLCTVFQNEPAMLKTLRTAVRAALPADFSIPENDPGDSIDELYMTGQGLQGCRTVAAVCSWAVMKSGVVVRKAEIIPAP